VIEAIECLSTLSTITKIQRLDNNLIAIATDTEGIKIFSYKDCDVKLTISSKYLNKETNSVCFSYDSKLLAFANENIIYIIDIKTYKLINSIKLDKETVQLMTFSLDSAYIIIGTSEGRVLQYKYNNDLLISRLCSFPYSKIIKSLLKNNFVSSFALYKNMFAVSGYGGSIYILNLFSSTNKNVITDNKLRTDALCFIDDNTLISGNNNGIVNIISLKLATITKQIVTPFSKIKQIILMPNPHYIMVNAQTNHTIVIDITTSTIVHNKYIVFKEKIQDILLLDNNSLIVSLQNSKILKIQLPNISKLNNLIDKELFFKAYKLIENEPMIRNSKEHNKLEKIYTKNFKLALQALITHNKPLAIKLVQNFKDIESKKDEIHLLFKAFDNYDKLKELFLEKKYPLVYAMSSKYPALQLTKEYLQTQEIWKKTFIQAQKEILLDRTSIAKELLTPYITIASKSTSIKLILNNNKEFLEFLQAIEKKDFKKIFKLVRQNKNFDQIPTYTNLNEEIEKSLLNITQYINNGEVEVAKESLSKFENILHINKRVKKLKLNCIKMQELQKAYKNKNLFVCYEIIDTNADLYNSKLGKLLNTKWSDIIKLCEQFALEGNILDIKNTLGELVNIPSRREKIGDLMRVSFHKRIKLLINKNYFKDAQNIIYSYINIFGIDKEIDFIIKEFEIISNIKLTITQEQARRHLRDSWINSTQII